MNNQKQISMFVPPDLFELLKVESADFDSFNKMMNRICREYFLHRQLKAEFKKVNH